MENPEGYEQYCSLCEGYFKTISDIVHIVYIINTDMNAQNTKDQELNVKTVYVKKGEERTYDKKV